MGSYQKSATETTQVRGAWAGMALRGARLAAGWSLAVGVALAAAAPAWAATARNAARPAAKTAVVAGARLNAELKSTLDAHKAKVGQKVTAIVRSNVKSHGHVVIPKGAKLFGTVTAVTRATKKNKRSAIGVLFYQAVTKHHRVIPLRAAISRILYVPGLAANGMTNMGMDSSMGGMAGGGMAGGGMAGPRGGMVGGAVGGAVGGVANTAGGAVGGMGQMAGDAAGGLGRMGANSAAGAGLHGVWRDSNGHPFAIRFPRLGSTAALYGQGSFLVGRNGDFKLNSGSQLQLETLGGAASASGAAHASAGTH
jgi:hypothetical protein